MSPGAVQIAIRALRSRNGYDPSVAEIAAEVEMSRTAVWTVLDKLRAEGIVELPRRFGGWRLTRD